MEYHTPQNNKNYYHSFLLCFTLHDHHPSRHKNWKPKTFAMDASGKVMIYVSSIKGIINLFIIDSNNIYWPHRNKTQTMADALSFLPIILETLLFLFSLCRSFWRMQSPVHGVYIGHFRLGKEFIPHQK